MGKLLFYSHLGKPVDFAACKGSAPDNLYLGRDYRFRDVRRDRKGIQQFVNLRETQKINP